MKGSGPSLLKSLTSKIHPPLSFNPKESRNLLRLLNSSFRQQLDKEHAVGNASSSHPINAHLHAVLSSPLLHEGHPRDSQREESSSEISVKLMQDLLARPMVHFQEQVATGKATIHIATRCLNAQRKNTTIYRGSVASDVASKESDSIRPVLHWLWASGLEESMDFVDDAQFLSSIIPPMIKNHHDQYMWKWLNKLHNAIRESDGEALKLQQTRLGSLLTHFVVGLVKFRRSMDEALKIFVRTGESLADRASLQIESVIRLPASRLIGFMMNEPSHPIDVGRYDEFVATLFRFEFHDSKDMYARLALCHPTRPDPSLALGLIQDPTEPSWSQLSPKAKRDQLVLYLRTAQALLYAQREAEAQELVSFVQKNMATAVPAHSKSYEQKDDEVENENDQFDLHALAT